MTALIIPNSSTFGSLTNSAVSRLAGIHTTLLRLNEAVATASAGFTGTPGTEFEATPTSAMSPIIVQNNFAIQPDPDSPGANGQAYADAITQLTIQWQAFWAAASPYIKQLDNGMAAAAL